MIGTESFSRMAGAVCERLLLHEVKNDTKQDAINVHTMKNLLLFMLISYDVSF